MKKILSILSILLLCSCSIQVNPRKVAYPFSIYAFKNDDNFQKLTKTKDEFGIALLSSTPYKSSTVELESGLDIKLFIGVGTGKNLADALNNVHIEGNNKINLFHVKSLIFHNNILYEDIFSKALSFFYFNNIIRPNIFFYTTSKDYKEIYNVSASNGKSPYFNLINTQNFPIDFYKMKQLTLNDFLVSYFDNNRTTYIIDLDITNDKEFIKEQEELIENTQYRVKGLYYTTLNRNQVLFEYLDINSLNGLCWYNKCNEFTLQTLDFKNQIYIEKSNYKRNIKENSLDFQITISVHDSLYLLDFDEIEYQIKNQILDDIVNTFKKAKEKNIDIYHIIDYAYRQNKKIETDTIFNVNLNFIYQNNAIS